MPTFSELDDLRRLHAGLITVAEHYREVRSRHWMQKPNEQENAKQNALRVVARASAVRDLQDKIHSSALHHCGLPVVRDKVDALGSKVAVLQATWRCLRGVAMAPTGPKAVAKLDAAARAALAQRDSAGLAAILMEGAQTVRDGFGDTHGDEAVAVLASIIADGPATISEAFRAKAEADLGAAILLEDAATLMAAIEADQPTVTIRSWCDRGEAVTVDIRNDPQPEPIIPGRVPITPPADPEAAYSF